MDEEVVLSDLVTMEFEASLLKDGLSIFEISLEEIRKNKSSVVSFSYFIWPQKLI